MQQLNRSSTGIMLIDVQGKLASLMYQSDDLAHHCELLIKGGQLLGLPIIWFEQVPDKLGSTLPSLAEVLHPQQPLIKTSFSGLQQDSVVRQIKATGCVDWLVCGIETHICVYQTVLGMLQHSLQPHVVVDAVSSRTLVDKTVGIEKMQSLGATITTVEMALFELMGDSQAEEFRDLSKLVK